MIITGEEQSHATRQREDREAADGTNFNLRQTHFINSVGDIHEALVGAVPGTKFGVAFCEASGKCFVRWSGTDAAMTELAEKNAAVIGADPLNVLNTLKIVPEVCRIYCATANTTEVVLAETGTGRGILGVVDGFSPKKRCGRGRDQVAHGLSAQDRLQAVTERTGGQ